MRVVTGRKITYANLDAAWLRYDSAHPDIEADVLAFIDTCRSDKNFAPKTTRIYIQIMGMFLRESGISFSARTSRLLKNRCPKNYPVTREMELTKAEIGLLLDDADTRLRAEILVAASSGMRIGEILSFSVSDINFNASPVEIYLSDKITKTKTARTVFISGEAVHALKMWLREKEGGVGVSAEKRRSARCFPYSIGNEILRLRRLLLLTELFAVDMRTNRTTIHFHLFRKFFLTEFKLAASAEVAEELAGHSGYLSRSYRRLTKKEMQTEYRKAEPLLTIGRRQRAVLLKETGCCPETPAECRYCAALEKDVVELKKEIQNLVALIRTPETER